jgi:hypothetical protein
MTEGEKKRKYIFDRYSENLSFLKINGIIDIDLLFEKTYICPICLNQFSEESLNQSIENPLTLEDAPPKSLGGKANILTCKKCNNTCGHKIDKHLTSRMLELDYHRFLPNTDFTAKFEIDGNIVQGKISIDDNGIMDVYYINKNNNPIKLQDYIEKINNNGTLTNIKIDKKQVNPINLQVALLKSGYLLIFEKYGYSLILNTTYARVREQLLNPQEVIYPLDFWLKAPLTKELFGVPFIIEKGIESICPIFPLKTKSSERVFLTIIPLYNKPIEDTISSFKKKCKTNGRVPIRFDFTNDNDNYLSNLEAIIKTKKMIENLNNV